MTTPFTSKLGKSEYERPKKTFTENLNEDDINNMLEDYRKVENIYQVPLNTHMRYFTTINGKKKFRTGGSLVHNQGLPKYVMLSNGKNSWPVQVKDTIFFSKMSTTDIKEEYEAELDELEQENKMLRKQLHELREKFGVPAPVEEKKEKKEKREVKHDDKPIKVSTAADDKIPKASESKSLSRASRLPLDDDDIVIRSSRSSSKSEISNKRFKKPNS